MPLTSLMPMTAEQLRQDLHYDPDTGIFTWRQKVARCVVVGTVAGNVRPDGYVSIRIRRARYLAHRLAWLYMTGAWPTGEVDHRDTNPSHNWWKNLRDVPPVVNKQNRRRPRSDSTTGLLGVKRANQKSGFTSAVVVEGKRVHLGTFPDASLAHLAYVAAKRELHEGNTL